MGSLLNGRSDPKGDGDSPGTEFLVHLVHYCKDLQQSQVSETTTEVQCQVNLPLMEEDQLRGYLKKPDTYKSLGLPGMHLQGLVALCQIPLESDGNWERFLRAGRKPMS